MTRYQVGPGTVSRAVAALVAEGLVETRPGSGTYVSSLRQERGRHVDTGWQSLALGERTVDNRGLAEGPLDVPEGTIVTSGGYLHRSLQPTRALSAALSRAARRPDAWDRAPGAGLSSLRSVFADLVGAFPEDVLITAGGQNALSIAFRAITPPGSPILVESPTYQGALAAARAAGLRPVPVPADEHGVRPDLLAEAFARTGAKVFYCQPTYQNPTGAVLAPERRPQVLAATRAAGAFLIEDDFARFLGHGAPVPPPLLADDQDGNVVHVSSLTKPAAPSLRVGALVARGPVLERLRVMRQVDDFFVSRPLQEAALELVSSPAWDRHLRTLAAQLRGRCHDLVTAIRAELPEWTVASVPRGGLHLWVRLPRGMGDAAVSARARQHGVAVSPGGGFFPAEQPDPYVRMNFAASASREELVESVRRLSEL